MIFRVQRSGNGDLDTELLNNQDGGRRRKVGLEGFTRGHAFTEMVCLARFLKPTLARPLVNLRRPQTNADGRRPQQCISHLLLGTAFHGKAARISYALIVSAICQELFQVLPAKHTPRSGRYCSLRIAQAPSLRKSFAQRFRFQPS